MKRFILIACLVAFRSIYLFAQDGTLDLSFGVAGKAFCSISNLQPDMSKIVVQPDGKIIQVGYHITGTCAAANNTDAYEIVVVRYNEDGSLDNTFGNSGKVFTSISGCQDKAFSVALQTDGKIVVVGTAAVTQKGKWFLINYQGQLKEDSSYNVTAQPLPEWFKLVR